MQEKKFEQSIEPFEKSIDKVAQKKQEKTYLKSFYLLRYLVSQLFEESKHLFAKMLFNIYGKETKNILKTISKEGFVIKRNYLTKYQVDSLITELDKHENYIDDTLEIPGSIRLKRYEKHSHLISLMCNNFDWMKLNLLYNFRLNKSVSMRSITSEKSLKNGELIHEDDREAIADYPHFDLYKRQLKFAIALSDITEENGPTEFIKYSSNYHFEAFSSYFSSWLALKKITLKTKPFLNEGFYERKAKSKSSKIILSKGDLFIFDSRNLHKATHLKKGMRDVLWFYY
jgi:hypothetical protein